MSKTDNFLMVKTTGTTVLLHTCTLTNALYCNIQWFKH